MYLNRYFFKWRKVAGRVYSSRVNSMLKYADIYAYKTYFKIVKSTVCGLYIYYTIDEHKQRGTRPNIAYSLSFLFLFYFSRKKSTRSNPPDVNRKWVEKWATQNPLSKARAKVGRSGDQQQSGIWNYIEWGGGLRRRKTPLIITPKALLCSCFRRGKIWEIYTSIRTRIELCMG